MQRTQNPLLRCLLLHRVRLRIRSWWCAPARYYAHQSSHNGSPALSVRHLHRSAVLFRGSVSTVSQDLFLPTPTLPLFISRRYVSFVVVGPELYITCTYIIMPSSWTKLLNYTLPGQCCHILAMRRTFLLRLQIISDNRSLLLTNKSAALATDFCVHLQISSFPSSNTGPETRMPRLGGPLLPYEMHFNHSYPLIPPQNILFASLCKMWRIAAQRRAGEPGPRPHLSPRLLRLYAVQGAAECRRHGRHLPRPTLLRRAHRGGAAASWQVSEKDTNWRLGYEWKIVYFCRFLSMHRESTPTQPFYCSTPQKGRPRKRKPSPEQALQSHFERLINVAGHQLHAGAESPQEVSLDSNGMDPARATPLRLGKVGGVCGRAKVWFLNILT